MRGIFPGILVVMLCLSFQALAESPPPAEESQCERAKNKYKAEHPAESVVRKKGNDFIFPPIDMLFGDGSPPMQIADYTDKKSGLTFHVESDGRHVTATDPTGKMRWRRNPFVDTNMCPYRSDHPYINWVGPPGGSLGAPSQGPPDTIANAYVEKLIDELIRRGAKLMPGKRFIGISFNSSQFGYLNIENGAFFFNGNN